jgi:spoIIIJ-associated protein
MQEFILDFCILSMDKLQEVKNIITELLDKMDFKAKEMEATEEEGNVVRININTDEASLLIGAQGRNLEAFQNLAKSLLWKKFPQEKFYLLIDVENFKKKKQEQIITLAIEKAEMVRSTKITQVLPPMSPFMRRMVHLRFKKDDLTDIATDSIGEEGARRVRLIWKGTGGHSVLDSLDDLSLDGIDI